MSESWVYYCPKTRYTPEMAILTGKMMINQMVLGHCNVYVIFRQPYLLVRGSEISWNTHISLGATIPFLGQVMPSGLFPTNCTRRVSSMIERTTASRGFLLLPMEPSLPYVASMSWGQEVAKGSSKGEWSFLVGAPGENWYTTPNKTPDIKGKVLWNYGTQIKHVHAEGLRQMLSYDREGVSTKSKEMPEDSDWIPKMSQRAQDVPRTFAKPWQKLQPSYALLWSTPLPQLIAPRIGTGFKPGLQPQTLYTCQLEIGKWWWTLMQHGGVQNLRHTQIVSKCEVLVQSINQWWTGGWVWWSMETQLGTNPMRQLSQKVPATWLSSPLHTCPQASKLEPKKRVLWVFNSIQGSEGQIVQITEDILWKKQAPISKL